mmetsp:Transcript_8370/g.16609  ORF Transcript_8370/g.16609 Transcript_8370/m.16609 type:complete len:405 (+) Transcript_8370:8921-10135(+)
MADDWAVPVAKRSQLYKNDFAGFMTQLKLKPDVTHIRLDMGDPTRYETFAMHPVANSILKEQVFNSKNSGLQDFRGDAAVRTKLAKIASVPDCELTADDVFIEYGCSGVMYNVFKLFCNPGDGVLLSNFGFPVASFMARGLGLDIRFYDLVHDGDWEPDFESLERQVTPNTKVFLVTNPSNPVGTVWARHTLEKIVEFAERHNLILLSDEVYGTLSFEKPFISLGEIPAAIPVICTRSISKHYMLCGVRIGWGLLYDRKKLLKAFPDTIKRLKITELHPNSSAITALGHFIEEVPFDYTIHCRTEFKRRAEFIFERSSRIPAITPIMPDSGMFMILRFDLTKVEGFSTTLDFVLALALETGVSFMPGDLIGRSGYLRVLLCPDVEVLDEGLGRLESYIRSKLKL